MSDTPILVNNRPFFGRTEEQKQFVRALEELRENSHGETLPYVFLLYGDGGIGKSTLARRFQDIAMREEPHAGHFQALWLDWEDEQWQRASLQVGHRFISAEAVFDTLHEVASRHNGWEPHFEPYRIAREERMEAERLAAAALTPTEGRDELTEMRNLGASMIACFMRTKLPIREGGEKLAKVLREAGLNTTAEQAKLWHTELERRLKTRLNETQYSLYLSPHQQLARRLSEGIRSITAEKPLLFFLDTYETVDEADRWLRVVIKESGPSILWMLAGRNDLTQDRQYGDEYFKGYTNDFPRRLLHYNMRRLAEEDVRAYFQATVPQRPLDEEALERISRATRGIPLAIREAAEIWRAGQPVSAIVGDTTDATPRKHIVKKMTERYMLHCIDNDVDRRGLYSLALARGDEGVLRKLLNFPYQTDFNLDTALRRLERDYASVHREQARLHDEPELFLRESLKVVHEDWVREMVEAALMALTWRCQELQVRLSDLEERCEDEDWIQAAVARCDYGFWFNEENGWRWLIPRFVEALGYSRELRQGLLKVAETWEPHLSSQGRKRLKHLMSASAYLPSIDNELLQELEQLGSYGWLDGEGAGERLAILSLRRGEWHFWRKQYPEALRAYDNAEKGLPMLGDSLRQQLGEALSDLAEKLMWTDGARFSRYSAEAARILPKVVEWLPQKAVAWYRLGVVLVDAKRYEEAIIAHQEAILLDSTLAHPHNSLGIIYMHLGRYEDAITAYQQAIRLDPTFAYPYTGLGIVYSTLERYEDAITAYQQAIHLDPTYVYPHDCLGNIYTILGRYEDAITAYKEAIRLDSTYASAHISLGNVYKTLQRYEEAMGVYQQVIPHARPYSSLSNSHSNLERHEDNTSHQQAMGLDPTYASAYHNLGTIYASLGRYDEAMAAYKAAIQIDPLAPYPHYNLADIYWRNGHFDGARRELNEFMRLLPECRFQPFVVLGVLAKRKGLEKSIEIFQKALPEWDEAMRSSRQSQADLLQQKAIALLCLGHKDEAMNVLAEAIPLMMPGDFVDEALWKLLRDAPEPPPGIDLAIAMVEAGRKQAEEKRDEDAGRR